MLETCKKSHKKHWFFQHLFDGHKTAFIPIRVVLTFDQVDIENCQQMYLLSVRYGLHMHIHFHQLLLCCHKNRYRKKALFRSSRVKLMQKIVFRFTSCFSDVLGRSRAKILKIVIFDNGPHFRLLRSFPSLVSLVFNKNTTVR